jgi:hypothetical protein
MNIHYKIQKYQLKYNNEKNENKKKIYRHKLNYYHNQNIMIGGNLIYVVNLLWINKTKSKITNQRVFFEIENIITTLVRHENRNLQFFIDMQNIIDEDLQIIMNFIQRIDLNNYVKIIDLRSIFLDRWSLGIIPEEDQTKMFGTALENIFVSDMAIYARVDFAKLLISMYNMEMFYRNPANRDKIFYNIFTDLAITDDNGPNIFIKELSYEYFFSDIMREKLDNFEIMMGKNKSDATNSARACENRFFIMKSSLILRTSLLFSIKMLAREIMKIYSQNGGSFSLRNIGFMYFRNLNFFIHHLKGNIAIRRRGTENANYSHDIHTFINELYSDNNDGLLAELVGHVYTVYTLWSLNGEPDDEYYVGHEKLRQFVGEMPYCVQIGVLLQRGSLSTF